MLFCVFCGAVGSVHGINANIVLHNTVFMQNFASKAGAAVSEEFHSNDDDINRSFIVMIRCHFADLGRDTCKVPGIAARKGEEDKKRRYGPSVLCVSLEFYRRLGALSLDNLKLMAADFESREHFKRPVRNLCSRWRLGLERALFYEIADIIALSLGHTSGLHRRRLRHALGGDERA